MPWKNQGGGPWGSGPKGPWGTGPQSAGPRPPDLEDLLRRGQDRLQQWLPGGHFSGMGIALVLVAALAPIADVSNTTANRLRNIIGQIPNYTGAKAIRAASVLRQKSRRSHGGAASRPLMSPASDRWRCGIPPAPSPR